MSQLEEDVATIQKEKDLIKENFSVAEEQIKKKDAKVASMKMSIEETQQEARQLQLDIVSSPDRMFNEIQRTDAELVECEEAIEDYKLALHFFNNCLINKLQKPSA